MGKGCTIYEQRPLVCQEFRCEWLKNPEILEEYRPDRVHFYVAEDKGDEVLKVRVDTDYPEAAKGSMLVESYLRKGRHVLVATGRQVTFLAGHGRPVPEKIVLEWVL